MGCGSSTRAESPQSVKPTKYPKQQGGSAAHQKQPAAKPPQNNAQKTVNNAQTPVQQSKAAPKGPSAPPPQKQRRNSADSETEAEVKKVQLNKQVLQRYIELEKETRHYENQNILKSLQVKNEQLEDLNLTVSQLQAHYKNCVQQTAKEKADVDQLQNPSVKNFFKDQSSFDAKMSKEQEEYLDALNRQEVAKKELDGVTKQRDQVTKDKDDLKKQADKLLLIYKEQDQLLASIFNGKYGSEQEYKLESELDMLLDKKQRISVANYKWHNARILLQHANNQLGVACSKWKELPNVKAEDTQTKYVMATEARNNLIAANQNITSAQRYLNTITFPYCKADEMETLSKATANIYTDMQTNERHEHATKCYVTTYKRAAALLQWFDHVINNVISKDLKKANTDVNAKTKELRDERLRLIKEKIKNELGEDVNFDIDNDGYDGDADDYEDELVELFEPDKVSQAGDVPSAPEAATAGQSSGQSLEPAAAAGALSAPTPLPSKDLAATPTSEDIFGDIDDLKKKHEQHMQEFQKAQELNKTRMQEGLQEKLRARRSRRERQAAHNEQLQQLS